MQLVNSLAPAYEAFLMIWGNLPAPIVLLAYTALLLVCVRTVLHFIMGS